MQDILNNKGNMVLKVEKLIGKGVHTLFFAVLFFLMPPITLKGQSQTGTMSIEGDGDGPIISKDIYGHFAEHLGRGIYDGLYVGKESPIPNTNGVRNDIITALRGLDIPNLRWPGGCFADTYHWKDGVGPEGDRPEQVNIWWGGNVEDNSFGTHDFLNLCQVLGAEPFISGNVGSGTVQELADWVQYTNFKSGPMSKLRETNGQKEPWGVTYWGIGNEAWGCGGNMTAEYYANVYRQYATYMSDLDIEGGLYKIASGASDGNYEWTEVIMKNVPKQMLQGISLHHYSVDEPYNKSYASDFKEDGYFKTMKSSWYMEELIEKHTQIMDKYDPDQDIHLIIDEWGGWHKAEKGTNPRFLHQQNSMRDAMIAGMNLNIFNSNAKRVKMANLAQTVNVLQAVILTEGEKMVLTPTYHVMKMYKVHQEARLLDISLSSPKYVFMDESIPAISASASRNEDGQINISLVNIDFAKNHKLLIDTAKLEYGRVTGKILTSDKAQDCNTFDEPTKIRPVKFDGFKSKKDELEVDLPPFSVIVLTLDKHGP